MDVCFSLELDGGGIVIFFRFFVIGYVFVFIFYLMMEVDGFIFGGIFMSVYFFFVMYVYVLLVIMSYLFVLLF